VGILLSIGLEVTDRLEIAKNHERDELVLYLKELLAVLLQRRAYKTLGFSPCRLASADEKRGRRAEVPCEKDTGEPS